jgi:EAL domain-containing protein (putative c-di-GMP-specific phosphodiesterase class I)
MLQDDRATLAALHALHTLGVRIAMDDFGTGYSSLSYLRGFPFDTIKIDRSFVSGLETSEESVAIVRTITGLGQILHMDTTAEGVETEEQCEILIAAGCTDMQGYLFGRPSPASSIPAAIERLSRPVAVSEQPAWELVAPAEATG